MEDALKEEIQALNEKISKLEEKIEDLEKDNENFLEGLKEIHGISYRLT